MDELEIRDAVHYGYPSPTVTVDLSNLKVDEVLPSFLDMRASALGMTGYGSTNRIRQFRGVPFECREAITKTYKHAGLLDDTTCMVMLRLQVHDLDRMEQLWRVIEDGLFLSSPENFADGHQTPIRRIFDWFVSHYVYNGHTETVAAYKTFIQFVKQKGSKSSGGELAKPCYFPWWNPSIGDFNRTGIYWLDVVLQRGVNTKDECRRFMHFISLRGAPCPNRVKMVTSLVEHQILRCSQPSQVDPHRLQELFVYGVNIAKRTNKKALARHVLRTEHLSVSNSSCLERPRSAGGRASYVQEKMVQWLTRVPSSDCVQRLVLGDEIAVRGGLPYWKSFCPVEPITETEMDPNVQFGSPIEGAFLPQYAGLNSNSGYSLLQWAFEEGVHRGVLDENLKVIGIPNQKALALGEPGDKARSLTIDEAWLTLYLTPLGHLLVDTLRTIPEVSAGLGYGQPCYHFVQRLSEQARKSPDLTEFFELSWLLTADLDKATDHFNQIKSRYLLRGYIHGLGKDFENAYCLSAIELLTSPRQCKWTI